MVITSLGLYNFLYIHSKRFFFVIFMFVWFMFFLSSCYKDCGQNGEKSLKVVATIFPQYDFVKQLTKDVKNVDVKMLVPPGADMHCFELTPQNVMDIKNCDLFVCVGGKSEVYVKEILKSIDCEKVKVVSLLTVVGEDKNFDDEKSHEHLKEGEPQKDEHVWTSLKNCSKIVEALTKELCKIDEKNSNSYKANESKYLKEINNLYEEFKGFIVKNPNKVVVFGDKFPFYWFFKDYEEYGLKYLAAYEGCSSHGDVNFKNLQNVINYVKKNKIPVVFKLEQSKGDIAKTISEETGAAVRTFYSCHGCSKEDFEKGETFLGIIKKNVKTLKEALV